MDNIVFFLPPPVRDGLTPASHLSSLFELTCVGLVEDPGFPEACSAAAREMFGTPKVVVPSAPLAAASIQLGA